MTVLGINGGFRQGYQDISACLVENGQVIAAIEEERLNRIKHSPGRLPHLSVLEVLKIGNKTIQDIDCLAFHGSTWGDEIDAKLKAYFESHFGYCPPIKRFHHHLCHAAASFFSSGFDESLIVTMDNSGDGVSLQIAIGTKNGIEVIKRFHRPNSLGMFYSLITQFCGFVKDSDEYKLMGLSAYGERTKYDFSWLLEFTNSELLLNTDYINNVGPKDPSLHRDEMIFNDHFVSRIGMEKRLPQQIIGQEYKDIAASAQAHLENVTLRIIEYFLKLKSQRNLCLAGGVALNCLMNQRLISELSLDNFFVQPASTDAGISLGAAWLASLEAGDKPERPRDAFLGNEYNHDEIKQILDTCNIKYEMVDDPAQTAADLLSANFVIGWFQGRMEFGPRALGNRSILANPQTPNIQSVINRKIKFREGFRPFGASILEEDFPIYFESNAGASPYMTITYEVRQDKVSQIRGVVHVDGTCRIQTVNDRQNPLFHKMLLAFKNLTGNGICLNTSFNLNHEPIVSSPQHAIAAFYGSGLDALILGDFLIKK